MNKINLKLFLFTATLVFLMNHISHASIQVTNLSLNSLLHYGSGMFNAFDSTKTEKNVNLNPKENEIIVLGLNFSAIEQNTEDLMLKTESDDDSNIEPAVDGDALCYPNPFRQTEGTILGYKLSKNLTVDIEVYDMLANRIINKTFKAGSKGEK